MRQSRSIENFRNFLEKILSSEKIPSAENDENFLSVRKLGDFRQNVLVTCSKSISILNFFQYSPALYRGRKRKSVSHKISQQNHTELLDY